MTTQPTPISPTSQPAPQALPLGEYACLIGVDWGDSRHAISLWARGVPGVERTQIDGGPEEVHRWIEALAERFGHQPVAIALEASNGPIVSMLLCYDWITLYPVHPATSRRYSQAFTPSGAANDQPDADNLLEILRFHRGRLRALFPQDEATRRLAALVALRRSVVDERTRLGNELTSLLKAYFPQALGLTGSDRHSRLAVEFLHRWPDLASLQKVKPQTLRAFYHKHQVRRPELIDQRLALVQSARLLSADPILIDTSVLRLRGILAQLRSLDPHLRSIEEQIEKTFASHEDRALFSSFPAAGAAMAPRLCVLFGRDRNRWSDAGALQKYYGVAPVLEASGKQRWLHWRWSAPVFARQTLVEWAGLSVRSSLWAKAFYLKQRSLQKSHAAILRALAFKWLRILFRCWKTRSPYNEDAYLHHLKLKGSPFCQLPSA